MVGLGLIQPVHLSIFFLHLLATFTSCCAKKRTLFGIVRILNLKWSPSLTFLVWLYIKSAKQTITVKMATTLQKKHQLYSVPGSQERLFWCLQEEVLSKGNIVSLSTFSKCIISLFCEGWIWGTQLSSNNAHDRMFCKYLGKLNLCVGLQSDIFFYIFV